MNSWKITAFAFLAVCIAFTQAARTIKLDTEDGESIEVDIKVANVSGTIAGLLEIFDVENDQEEIRVPLPNVNAKILRLVLEWSEKHKDDEVALSTEDKKNVEIPAWDAEFLAKLEQDTLFEVILAANYLDVNGLLEVSCKTVANMIKAKSPEEIRKTFNIKNDFTPEEEEEQMRKENNWQE